MYIYPDHLNSKATLWVWTLKSVILIGILLLLGVLAFAVSGSFFFLIAGFLYMILTIRVDDNSILGFLQYAGSYFLFGQQAYVWHRQV
ncbi:MAG: hypothetical protein KHW81_15975 [[Clostridium] innocuum]|nr:hypothetical protein [[Clostridium] innocuum]MBS5685870.1 hypothetical protein [[Clostridium] innocuum]